MNNGQLHGDLTRLENSLDELVIIQMHRLAAFSSWRIDSGFSKLDEANRRDAIIKMRDSFFEVVGLVDALYSESQTLLRSVVDYIEAEPNIEFPHHAASYCESALKDVYDSYVTTIVVPVQDGERSNGHDSLENWYALFRKWKCSFAKSSPLYPDSSDEDPREPVKRSEKIQANYKRELRTSRKAISFASAPSTKTASLADGTAPDGQRHASVRSSNQQPDETLNELEECILQAVQENVKIKRSDLAQKAIGKSGNSDFNNSCATLVRRGMLTSGGGRGSQGYAITGKGLEALKLCKKQLS